jgi:hypothetical protein
MRPQRRDLQAEPQTKAQNQREQRNTDPQEPTHEGKRQANRILVSTTVLC